MTTVSSGDPEARVPPPSRLGCLKGVGRVMERVSTPEPRESDAWYQEDGRMHVYALLPESPF